MKKILAICLALVMLLSTGLTAFAAGFVASPSNNAAPEIVSVEAAGVPEGFEFKIKITPFKDVETLASPAKEDLYSAYDEIKASTDLTKLAAELDAVAKKLNVKTEDLAVADLFDISANTEQHGEVKIKLRSDNAKNFVAVLHRYNGKWTVVDGAKVENAVLSFSVDDFSPFAIVVNTSGTPQTGDNSMIFVWAVIAGVSALAIVFCIVKAKKSDSK